MAVASSEAGGAVDAEQNTRVRGRGRSLVVDDGHRAVGVVDQAGADRAEGQPVQYAGTATAHDHHAGILRFGDQRRHGTGEDEFGSDGGHSPPGADCGLGDLVGAGEHCGRVQAAETPQAGDVVFVADGQVVALQRRHQREVLVVIGSVIRGPPHCRVGTGGSSTPTRIPDRFSLLSMSTTPLWFCATGRAGHRRGAFSGAETCASTVSRPTPTCRGLKSRYLRRWSRLPASASTRNLMARNSLQRSDFRLSTGNPTGLNIYR